MRHGKVVRSSAKIVRSTTQQAKIKGVEFFSGASEKQSTERHLSILNFLYKVHSFCIEHFKVT
jgi:hypothetical protein